VLKLIHLGLSLVLFLVFIWFGFTLFLIWFSLDGLNPESGKGGINVRIGLFFKTVTHPTCDEGKISTGGIGNCSFLTEYGVQGQ
jgi:hypothetical protein